MSSIIKKKRQGITYYYIVDNKRINGKPRHVNQVYIGNSNTIRENITSDDNIKIYSKVFEYGASKSIFRLISELGLIEIIENNCKKRNQGFSNGELAAIGIINRICNPCSKLQINNWYKKTLLKEDFNIKGDDITSLNFCKSMEYLTEQVIENIENEFVPMLIKKYDISTSHLIYDATNFFTFLAKETESVLAKTGHDKANQVDKRTVGLSMIVTPDGSIPLMHDVYPGNTHDSVEFKKVLNNLKNRYEKLLGSKMDVTITFDRGNNSEDTIEKIADIAKDMHYVGGLRLSQISKTPKKADVNLLEIPISQYVQHNKKQEIKLYRCSKYLYDKEHTVLLMYNEKSYKKQEHTLEENINKCLKELQQLKDAIQTPVFSIKQSKRTKASTTTLIKNIFSNKDYMSQIIEFDVIEKNGGISDIVYKVNEEKKAKIKDTHLGKRALYTNRDEWTNEEIEEAYTAAWHVEQGFRQMKDDECIKVSPMFHWTDSRIRAHMFYCVMAYRICCIMKKELRDNGIDISIDEIVNKLSSYMKVVTVEGKFKIINSYTETDSITNKILEIFGTKM